MAAGSTKNAVLVVIVLAALGVAGFLLTQQLGKKKHQEGLDRVMHFVCNNPSCESQFDLTIADFNQQTADTPDHALACPNCGKYDTKRAYPCPECGKNVELIGHGGLPETCKHCGSQLRDNPAFIEQFENSGR